MHGQWGSSILWFIAGIWRIVVGGLSELERLGQCVRLAGLAGS